MQGTLEYLVHFVKEKRKNIAVMQSFDVRGLPYPENMPDQDFEMTRAALAKFSRIFQNVAKAFFVVQSHGTGLEHVKPVLPSNLPSEINNASRSSTCYCGRLNQAFFDFCTGCFAGEPANRIKMVVNVLSATNEESINHCSRRKEIY